MYTRLGIALAVVTTLGSPVLAQRAESLIGCFDVRLGKWSGSFPSGAPADHQPPSSIRLDSAHLAERYRDSSYRRLEPNIEAFGNRGFAPAWRITRGDSLLLSWSNGFSGVVIVAAIGRDSLVGMGEAFTDYIGPKQPTVPVVLVRRPCM
jgi:hypothetical protein